MLSNSYMIYLVNERATHLSPVRIQDSAVAWLNENANSKGLFLLSYWSLSWFFKAFHSNRFIYRSVPWHDVKPERSPDCHTSARAQTMAETPRQHTNTQSGRNSGSHTRPRLCFFFIALIYVFFPQRADSDDLTYSIKVADTVHLLHLTKNKYETYTLFSLWSFAWSFYQWRICT